MRGTVGGRENEYSFGKSLPFVFRQGSNGRLVASPLPNDDVVHDRLVMNVVGFWFPWREMSLNGCNGRLVDYFVWTTYLKGHNVVPSRSG